MQISGAWSAEVPTERLARLVAADVIEHLGRPEVLDAIGAAIAGRMAALNERDPEPVNETTEPDGYPVGGRHQAAGSYDYDREPESGTEADR